MGQLSGLGVSGATSGLQMFIENNTVKSIGYGINLSSSHSSYSRIKVEYNRQYLLFRYLLR